MRSMRVVLGLSSAILSCHVLAGAADAQTDRSRAPVIRVNTSLGSSVASNYIEPTISLSEDAYVFAI